jgi:hypothetical protein
MTDRGLVPSLARSIFLYSLAGLLGALACSSGGARRAESANNSATGALPPPDTIPPQPVQWEPARLDTLLHAEGFNPILGGAASAFTSNNVVFVVRSKSAELRERIRRVLTDPEVKGTLSP